MCSADLCRVLCVLKINVLLIRCLYGTQEDIQNCMFIKVYYYSIQRDLFQKAVAQCYSKLPFVCVVGMRDMSCIHHT